MTLRTYSLLLAFCSGLTAALPSVSSAQRITSPYEFIEERQSVNVFAGYFATSTGDLDLGPEPGPAVGGRYGIRISGPFVLEATVGVLPTSRMVIDTIPNGGTEHVGDADLNLLFGDAALRFDVTGPRTFHGLLPYLSFGAGAAGQIGSTDGDDSVTQQARYRFGTTFAGQFGGGIEWLGWRRVGIRADARNMLWRVRTPRAFLDQDPSRPSREWTQNFLFSLGLSYRF